MPFHCHQNILGSAFTSAQGLALLVPVVLLLTIHQARCTVAWKTGLDKGYQHAARTHVRLLDSAGFEPTALASLQIWRFSGSDRPCIPDVPGEIDLACHQGFSACMSPDLEVEYLVILDLAS
jgi:hypothetical protein